MNRFLGKIVVVTGAGRGIGQAAALGFAKEGARVTILSRTVNELEITSNAIFDVTGTRPLMVAGDVSDEKTVAAVFARTNHELGPVDCLINNAGILIRAEIEQHSAKDWDSVMAVNVRGPFLMSRELFRQCRKLKRIASIVNVSSLSGVRGYEKFPGFGSYVVSKFGLVGLTDILAVEGKSLGIRVNCIAPGAVDTKMLRDAAPLLRPKAKPEDIVPTILHLSNDAETSVITGAIIEIDSNAYNNL